MYCTVQRFTHNNRVYYSAQVHTQQQGLVHSTEVHPSSKYKLHPDKSRVQNRLMTRDGLRLPSLAHHEQLWKDGDRFQVDAPRPQDLDEAELVVE